MVSIVVPVYNKKFYLEDCLKSLLCQTWHDLEIIVVEDGSTDGSWEELSVLAQKESRINLLQISHSGPSAARNTGMMNAKGDYITFVDADDFVEAGYIEHLVQSIGDADFCISGYKTWYQREDRWEKRECISAVLSRDELYSLMDKMPVFSGIGWKLYRRSFLEGNHILFPDQINQAEDHFFLCEVLLNTNKAVCIESMEYIVRCHDPNSLSHQRMTVETTEKTMAEYEKLRNRTDHPQMISYIITEQMGKLCRIGELYCFQNMKMRTRKQLFFRMAEKYHLINNSLSCNPRSKSAMLVRFTLAFRIFLPFFVIVRFWRHF